MPGWLLPHPPLGWRLHGQPVGGSTCSVGGSCKHTCHSSKPCPPALTHTELDKYYDGTKLLIANPTAEVCCAPCRRHRRTMGRGWTARPARPPARLATSSFPPPVCVAQVIKAMKRGRLLEKIGEANIFMSVDDAVAAADAADALGTPTSDRHSSDADATEKSFGLKSEPSAVGQLHNLSGSPAQ